MLDRVKLEQAAKNWIDVWNKRDFEGIMSHYAEDVEFNSATVIRRWGNPDGRLAGRSAVEKHFRKGLEEVPGINFNFHSILYGIDSIILLYTRENGMLAADMVRFDQSEKVVQVTNFQAPL